MIAAVSVTGVATFAIVPLVRAVVAVAPPFGVVVAEP